MTTLEQLSNPARSRSSAPDAFATGRTGREPAKGSVEDRCGTDFGTERVGGQSRKAVMWKDKQDYLDRILTIGLYKTVLLQS